MKKIGDKIREKRIELGITGTELAFRTGYSQSFISQVERGITNPSVGAVKKIATGLGIPVPMLFDGVNSQVDGNQAGVSHTGGKVVRKNERKGLLYPGSDIRYELLSPDLQGPIEFLMVTSPPGSSIMEPFVHDGKEYGLVLQGKMELWIGEEHYVLEAGDSIYFDSTLPHLWANNGTEDLIIVWAGTPPSF